MSNPVLSDIRSTRLLALGVAALGVAFIGLFVLSVSSRGGIMWTPGIIGCCLIAVARYYLSRCKRRLHGLRVEDRVMDHAAGTLSRYGFTVQANVCLPGHGDIDMVITRDGERYMPVEIKAFESWGMDWSNRKRRDDAIKQVTHALNYLEATHGFIWLPEARAGWWRRTFGLRRGSITIVFGSATRLARIANRRA
jgi:hypothetical protein